MRYFLLNLFAILFLAFQVNGQHDYVQYDTTTSHVVTLIKGSVNDNCQFIKVKGEERTYTPEDINGYGFKDGTVYVSKTILVDGRARKVFLLQLVNGKASLYYYTSADFTAYYLQEQDLDLVQLPGKDEFRNALRDFMLDCDAIAGKVDIVDYNKKQLSKLVSMYNACSSKPISGGELGVVVGYSIDKLATPANYTGNVEETDWSATSNSFMVGISYNQPFYRPYFSAYTNLVITKTSYATTHKDQNVDTDVLIKLVSIELPVMFRYTVQSVKYGPFIYAGGLFCFNIENSGRIYEATTEDDQIHISLVSNERLVNDISIGYGFGAGLRRSVGFRNSVSIEARYTSIGYTAEYLNRNQFVILAGFTF